MLIESFPVGPLACNCIFLADESSREAIVIDPGAEAKRIHRRLNELGLAAKQIILTHAHIDHVGASFQVRNLTGAPILLHENDLSLLATLDAQAAWLGIDPPEVAQPDASLSDGQTIALGHYTAKVLHTPGHTQGSGCLYFEEQNLLISGDTLFAGSIGRTDLPGGNYDQIIASIHSRLKLLPDETRVYPGHGPTTKIGEERAQNPFFRPEARTQY
jgi:glyoxylase-like metal-dependent hydrolase (beta-lactamase superfamily II)